MWGGDPQRPLISALSVQELLQKAGPRGSGSRGSWYKVPEGDSMQNSRAWLGQKGSETTMRPQGSKIQNEESQHAGVSCSGGAQEGRIRTLGGGRGMDWWYLITIF